jgi:7,8-dihydropterin-6-yl-methyl-4-(beta-D-ribofuranosyl)aminobenzene 5'-phosphate synthase
LWDILKTTNKKGLPVYVCPNFSDVTLRKIKKFGANPIKVEKLTEVSPDIYTTGEIVGDYKGQPISEQSIIIKTDKGVSLITGCAHPNIVTILKKTKKNFPKDPIYFVMGGFHLLHQDTESIKEIVKEFKSVGVERVAPTHCSGEKTEEIFQQGYGENFVALKVGKVVKL